MDDALRNVHSHEAANLVNCKSAQIVKQAAIALIERRSQKGVHHIGCALLTEAGELFLGLHLSSSFGPSSTCAEAAAISQSQIQRQAKLAYVACARETFEEGKPPELVLPCAACRERILQFGPSALVVLDKDGRIEEVSISSLLPRPFQRRSFK